MNYKEHDELWRHVTRGRSFGTDLTTAKVCVCDTDLCNGQTAEIPMTKLGLCLPLVITVWLNI
ncbi:hypothetical protein HOLleu_29448 [Holothuria leucospilota]|uniref:Uncharacterized protein n=1 Tax=Holothuria leucospilota TaxID=206669 RepID=A0A9Q1BNR4_HOLLE|nr:hypothetical protein HOLleu_29448 [Holothuria leucospilota]